MALSVLKHHSPFPCLHKLIQQESLQLQSRQMFFVKWTCQMFIKFIVEINIEWKLMVVLHNSCFLRDCCLANFIYLLLCMAYSTQLCISSKTVWLFNHSVKSLHEFIQHHIQMHLHPAHKPLRLIIQLVWAQVTQPIACKLFNETSKMWMYRSVTRSLCMDLNVFWKAFTQANGSDWVSLSLSNTSLAQKPLMVAV